MLEKLSGVASMRALVAAVAEAQFGDNHKSVIGRAAHRARISWRQAKSLFYAEITDRNHKSARLLRDAAEGLAGRYEATAQGMRNVDADFYSAEIDRLVRSARALRNMASPRNDSD